MDLAQHCCCAAEPPHSQLNILALGVKCSTGVSFFWLCIAGDHPGGSLQWSGSFCLEETSQLCWFSPPHSRLCLSCSFMSGQEITCQFSSSAFADISGGLQTVFPCCMILMPQSLLSVLAESSWTMSGILSNRKTCFFPCLNQGRIKNHNTYFQLNFQLLTPLLLYFYPQSWFFLE